MNAITDAKGENAVMEVMEAKCWKMGKLWQILWFSIRRS